jgi:hypothetical protein
VQRDRDGDGSAFGKVLGADGAEVLEVAKAADADRRVTLSSQCPVDILLKPSEVSRGALDEFAVDFRVAISQFSQFRELRTD